MTVLGKERASLCPEIFWSRWGRERRNVTGNQDMPWH